MKKTLFILMMLALFPVSSFAAQQTILSGAGVYWTDEKDKINSNFTELYGWGDHSLVGYLTNYTETDPIFLAWDKDYNDLINTPTITPISDLVYGVGWNGNTDGASKNAIYDKIESLAGGHDAITLGTTNGLSLSVQELSLTAATNVTAGAATAAQITKLEGIATGATVNSTDATLLARANHTGTQTASTVSDFDTEVGNHTDVTANTAKVSNATHTGDVTGDIALTIAVDAVDVPMLSATGTADATTFLRGDNVWTVPTGSGDVSKVGTPVDNQVCIWTGDGTIEGHTGMVYNSGTGVLTVAGTIEAGSYSGIPTTSGPQFTRFLEATGTGSNYVGWGSQSSNNNDLIWLLPSADPTVGQVMAWAVPTSVTFSDGTARDATVGSWTTPLTSTAVTYENLNTNGDVGTGATQVSQGDHAHTGTYEPADATILKDVDIGSTVADVKADTNTYQWVFNALDTVETAPDPLMSVEVPVGVDWTTAELVCDGTTITGLVITIGDSATPDGTYSAYTDGTLSTEGTITITNWTDPTAGTNVGAYVSTVSTGDATWCKLITTLTNN